LGTGSLEKHLHLTAAETGEQRKLRKNKNESNRRRNSPASYSGLGPVSNLVLDTGTLTLAFIILPGG
jgi:hypothetical protein